jgi:MFS family permease
MKQLHYGWVIVLCCFGINAVVHGIRYSFGVFFKSLSSDFMLSRAGISGISSLYWVLCGIFALLGGTLLNRYGPKKILLVMGGLTGLSLIVTSFTTASWQLFLSYSLLLSTGTGACYSVMMTTTQRWFSKRRGLAVGIVSAGVGIGTIIMTPLSAYLVTIFEWRTTFLMTGLVLGIIMVLFALPLKRDPDEAGLLPFGSDRDSIPDDTIITGESSRGIPLLQALRTKDFWLIAVIWFSWAFSLLTVLTHLVPHLTDIGISLTSAAAVSGLIGMVSIAGRLGIGWYSDTLDRRASALFAVLLQAAALFLLALSQDLRLFYIFAVVYGIGYGGLDPATLALVGDIFGMRYLGQIMGVLLPFWSVGAGIGAEVGGLIYDSTGSYFRAFVLCAILMTAAAGCTMMIGRKNSNKINTTNTTNGK